MNVEVSVFGYVLHSFHMRPSLLKFTFCINCNWSLKCELYDSLKDDILFTVAIKFVLAKYYKDSEMTAYISERSRNSK